MSYVAVPAPTPRRLVRPLAPPRFGPGLRGLGTLYGRLGWNAEHRRAVQLAAERFPDDVGALHDLLLLRDETGDAFHISVACYPETHPQAHSPQADIDALAAKARAGADVAITQYFYNSDAYFRLLEDMDAAGVNLPVVPCILPITNSAQLLHFSQVCGAEIPRWIRLRLQSYGDDLESIKAFGLEVVSDLCHQLVAVGVPSLHFYTLNQSGPTLAICKELGLAVPEPSHAL